MFIVIDIIYKYRRILNY